MGKLVLIGRLAAKDIGRHPARAVLLLLAIMAATSVLTLGLALRGVTSHPYQQTRAATKGPDVVAYLPVLHQPGRRPELSPEATALTRAAGVTGHAGPFPDMWAVLRVHGLTAGAEVQGRAEAASPVDQPKLTAGSWVRPGGVVIERTFAEALGVGVGDRVTLNGRTLTVAGIAVTAARPPYPNLCYINAGGCMGDFPSGTQIPARDIGLTWATGPDTAGLVTPADPLAAYVVELRLGDPAQAQAFVTAHSESQDNAGPSNLAAWPGIAAADGLLVQDEQDVLSPGALLAALLAMASVAVLAGGRMAEHSRRTGLLKAAGSGPGLVAAVLLAENLILALTAAAAGLLAGWLAAPLITGPGAALVGTPGAPSLTFATAGEVTAVALVVALVATLVPAVRAARISTVRALADVARPPRRRPGLIAVSRQLPVPLLLGLRLAARRLRRAALSTASFAVTTTGLVAVLSFHVAAGQYQVASSGGLSDPAVTRDGQILLVITVVLIGLTVLNAVCAAWTTALDARAASALARALGATPRQVSAAIAAAQVLPAVPGALLGIPLGIELFAAASHIGRLVVPPAWWLAAGVLGVLVAAAALASIPAWAGARQPAAEILQAEAV
jgi:ABC-type lipoprotein release transport system permease subunit